MKLLTFLIVWELIQLWLKFIESNPEACYCEGKQYYCKWANHYGYP